MIIIIIIIIIIYYIILYTRLYYTIHYTIRAWTKTTAFNGVWDLLVPRSRTAIGQRSFAVNGPRTWNSLPADLRTPDTTLCSFKRHLKAHLFQQ